MRKHSTSLHRFVTFIGAGVVVAAFASASPAVAQAKTKSKAAKSAGVDIMLMKPTAVKAGENQFEVMVKGADGKPINDAEVSVLFVMPKTATMAEMRNEVKLKPSGNGTYMGPGNVMMAGAWNTTVSVKQGGKEIGRKKLTLTAK
jgi:YtkA-like protein